MAVKDDRVDTYIAEAADFARPVMEYLRETIHRTCPEVEEGIKWGFPAFDYKGYLCGLAAHKNHLSLTFWKGKLMADPHGLLEDVGKTGMGQLGKITSLEDLPEPTVLEDYLREAMRLNDEGVKVPNKLQKRATLDIPEYFMTALERSPEALEVFRNFSYTNKKEYVEWLTGAKTEKTRTKRLNQAIEWIAEGKVRNWKYIK